MTTHEDAHRAQADRELAEKPAKESRAKLRDEFAKEAMKQMAWSDENTSSCAAECYVIADAMLAARDSKE